MLRRRQRLARRVQHARRPPRAQPRPRPDRRCRAAGRHRRRYVEPGLRCAGSARPGVRPARAAPRSSAARRSRHAVRAPRTSRASAARPRPAAARACAPHARALRRRASRLAHRVVGAERRKLSLARRQPVALCAQQQPRAGTASASARSAMRCAWATAGSAASSPAASRRCCRRRRQPLARALVLGRGLCGLGDVPHAAPPAPRPSVAAVPVSASAQQGLIRPSAAARSAASASWSATQASDLGQLDGAALGPREILRRPRRAGASAP